MPPSKVLCFWCRLLLLLTRLLPFAGCSIAQGCSVFKKSHTTLAPQSKPSSQSLLLHDSGLVASHLQDNKLICLKHAAARQRSNLLLNILQGQICRLKRNLRAEPEKTTYFLPGMVEGAGMQPGMMYMPLSPHGLSPHGLGHPQQQWPAMMPWMGPYFMHPSQHAQPEPINLMAAGRSTSAPDGPASFSWPSQPVQASGAIRRVFCSNVSGIFQAEKHLVSGSMIEFRCDVNASKKASAGF